MVDKIDNLTNLAGIGAPSTPATERPAQGGSELFAEALMRAEAAVTAPEAGAARAIETLVEGGNGRIHETMLAVDKAEISLKYMVSVRNRILEAYREVMRMGS